ncbi:MAG TPA: UvrD-helicase domain-containing protein, partial [Clostridia bacterium]|nr:UvrD-helicase domain-containing protein [Clostridia bacterium]
MSFINNCKLNKQQKEAVLITEGPLLVIAGAGSGKTRVLTHRIAHMILDKGIPAYSILAITFTNKAANEMRERVMKMVGDEALESWIMTFHSCCVRILRREIESLGYGSNFTIFDDNDQQSLVAKLLKDILPNGNIKPKSVIDFISGAKNKMLSPDEVRASVYDQKGELFCDIYEKYESELRRNNALDFDDLLNKTVELFEKFPDVLERYRARFRYILVDEYQDTNFAQYRLVKLLGQNHRNVCVVGDDDQSIYGWRGADYTNIFSFEKDFKETVTVMLEQNYRSTKNILDCANSIISGNSGRKPKKLWTETGRGEKIHVEMLYDEQTEADFVYNEIMRLRDDGYRLSDFAVLYRTNAVGRTVQKTLARRGVPFEVYGDVSFYNRKEIKDALAYMRILVNPSDEVSLLRIINEPKRGIGDAAISEISQKAREHNETIIGYILDEHIYNDLQPKTQKKIAAFCDLLKELIMISVTRPLTEIVRAVIDKTGLKAQYEESYLATQNIEDSFRLENLEALISDAAEYERSNAGGLADYLESISLSSSTDGLTEQGNVKLMTLHSSKGL